jgi:hypothetical protein
MKQCPDELGRGVEAEQVHVIVRPDPSAQPDNVPLIAEHIRELVAPENAGEAGILLALFPARFD